MKRILSLMTRENQGKGEISATVIRGHASVQLAIELLGTKDQSLDIHLKPTDALQIAEALKKAAEDIPQIN